MLKKVLRLCVSTLRFQRDGVRQHGDQDDVVLDVLVPFIQVLAPFAHLGEELWSRAGMTMNYLTVIGQRLTKLSW